MLSVIIPFFNKWELTHRRMMDLYSKVPVGEIEIILVNDCSTEDCDGGIGFRQKSVNGHPIRYIKNSENLGFGGSMNKGIKKALLW